MPHPITGEHRGFHLLAVATSAGVVAFKRSGTRHREFLHELAGESRERCLHAPGYLLVDPALVQETRTTQRRRQAGCVEGASQRDSGESRPHLLI